MALTEDTRQDLELWMEKQRAALAAILRGQVQQAVSEALAKRQYQGRPARWKLTWLWLRGLVWKYNPVRLFARRRFARMDKEQQWEHIGSLLTKATAPRRANDKLKPGYVVKGHIPVDPRLALPSRELTAQEDEELWSAFRAQEDQKMKDAASTLDVMQLDLRKKLL